MDKLQPYLDAFTSASDRTRAIYIIIVAFSVMSLAAFLNSSDMGWHRSRLRKVKLAYAYLTYLEALNKSPGTQPIPQPIPLTEKEKDEAKSYIELASLKTAEEAKMVLNNVEKQVADSNVIQIPLFGLSFHINDLGFVSGVSLVMLLLLLKHALTREVENLELAATKAQDLGIVKDAYEILSTGEVLHRPESLTRRKLDLFSRPLMDTSVVLLYVPVVSYALVMANDFRTAPIGLYLSPAYATFILTFEVAALSLMIFLAYSCFVIVRETRVLWNSLLDVAPKKECGEGCGSAPIPNGHGGAPGNESMTAGEKVLYE